MKIIPLLCLLFVSVSVLGQNSSLINPQNTVVTANYAGVLFNVTNNNTSGNTVAISGTTFSKSGGAGVAGFANSSTNNTHTYGIYGQNNSDVRGYGVYGSHLGAGDGVRGESNGGFGVSGNGSIGVDGVGSTTGVYGFSLSGTGGFFSSTNGYALITGFGNVGIGTSTPTEKLNITGNVLTEGSGGGFRFNDRLNNVKGYQWYATGGNAYLYRHHATLGNVISVFENGNVGIGRDPNALYKLDVNGDIRANATVYTSDIRLKKDFSKLNASLSKLAKLDGYHYYWKDAARGKDLQTGVIAQEVEKIFPELVSTDDNGYKSVNYIGFIPHLIESVKVLKNENEALKLKNDQTTAALAEVLVRLDKLEANKTDKKGFQEAKK